MSKLINEPIKVVRRDSSAITAFVWRKHIYRVEDVMSWWRETPQWWNGELVRCFLRLSARNSSAGVFEICKIGKDWFLHRVLD